MFAGAHQSPFTFHFSLITSLPPHDGQKRICSVHQHPQRQRLLDAVASGGDRDDVPARAAAGAVVVQREVDAARRGDRGGGGIHRQRAVAVGQLNIDRGDKAAGALHGNLVGGALAGLDLDQGQLRGHQRRLVHLPMGRFGEAKEMAYAALYLASDESSYVTGTEFMVDGGLTAAYVTPE